MTILQFRISGFSSSALQTRKMDSTEEMLIFSSASSAALNAGSGQL